MSNSGAPSRSVEVFIVDTQSAAARALAAHRPTAEATHVLCRHADESGEDFSRRVLERTRRIQKCRRIHSLWYVVGSSSAERPCSVPLLDSLVEMLDGGANLTVVGPGNHQQMVLTWLDELVLRHRSRVTLRAQLYPHREAPAPVRRAPARPASAPVRHRTFEGETLLAESA